ncbi:hypothetical protein, partial [Desulfovibrio sp.]|uniref:hypothetical protein n=2 Tax=Desulfovibrio sp. TaxID=885 RepID=UPI003AB853AE
GGHVHDDATLEHFCKTGLQANGALFHEKTPLSIQQDMQRKGKKALLPTAGEQKSRLPGALWVHTSKGEICRSTRQ